MQYIHVQNKQEYETKGWTSTKERLPDSVGTYIVYCTQTYSNYDTQKFVRLAYFVADKFETESSVTVTHWMPLHEPPKD